MQRNCYQKEITGGKYVGQYGLKGRNLDRRKKLTANLIESKFKKYLFKIKIFHDSMAILTFYKI